MNTVYVVNVIIIIVMKLKNTKKEKNQRERERESGDCFVLFCFVWLREERQYHYLKFGFQFKLC